jgi:hypothetical protein
MLNSQGTASLKQVAYNHRKRKSHCIEGLKGTFTGAPKLFTVGRGGKHRGWGQTYMGWGAEWIWPLKYIMLKKNLVYVNITVTFLIRR